MIEQLDDTTEVKRKNKRGRPSFRNFSPPDDLRIFGQVKRLGGSVKLDKYVTKPAKNILNEKGYNIPMEIDYFVEPRTIFSFNRDGKKFIAVALTRLNNRTNLLVKEK